MELYKMSLWQIFLAGGPVMWPILLCSVFAVAIILEKFIYLHKIKIDTQEFLSSISFCDARFAFGSRFLTQQIKISSRFGLSAFCASSDYNIQVRHHILIPPPI